MSLTNYFFSPADVDLIIQAVQKVTGQSITNAGRIALENIANTDDLRSNVQIIIGESVQSGVGGLTITFSSTTGITTLTLDADLSALAALATTGIIARTGAGTVATRSLVEPSAGIDIANADGVSGNPAFTLANDLAALEGLNSSGFGVRTANDTWALRSITGAAGLIDVVDGNGVSGNPEIALAEIGTPGTYQSVTTDAYGRVVSGESGIVLPVVTKSANYTATSGDYAILCSATLTLSLPAAASNTGRSYAVRNTGAGTVTIDPNSTEQIDGAATKALTSGQFATIVCDGTQWFTIG